MGLLVLDKCYLQAATWEAINGLAKHHELVLTGSCFYELLSGSADARRRVFAKLPRTDSPLLLLDNLSTLLAHEAETHTQFGDVRKHTLDLTYRFNPRLVEPDWKFSAEVLEGVAEKEAQTRRLVDLYVERTNVMTQVFRRVTVGSDAARRKALEEIETEISVAENVMLFYQSLDDPTLPPARLVTAEWATFRFYQTALLFSLHTLHRHKGPLPLPMSQREFVRLEHDVHDHIALCVALLAGGLATHEKKLRGWFSLLSPHGLLVPARSNLASKS